MTLDSCPESTSPPPKPRHVDLYFDEWIAGQVGLSNPERGLYLTACLFIYSHGGSVAEEDLRAACRDHGTAYKTQLATLLRLGKLTLNGGQITNKRCSNELERAEKRVGNAQQNGQKGGRPSNKNNEIAEPAGSGDEKLTTNYQLPTTNQKERLPPTPLAGGESGDPNLPGIATPESPPLPSPPKSRRNPRITAETAQLYDLDFETWYRAYPKRKGKDDACRAYRKARTTGVTRERLLASVQSYIVEMGGREQFIKHPATWLNKGCWEDEPDKPAATDYTWGAPGFA